MKILQFNEKVFSTNISRILLENEIKYIGNDPLLDNVLSRSKINNIVQNVCSQVDGIDFDKKLSI